MDATRQRRFRDAARQRWYARFRCRRFAARLLGDSAQRSSEEKKEQDQSSAGRDGHES